MGALVSGSIVGGVVGSAVAAGLDDIDIEFPNAAFTCGAGLGGCMGIMTGTIVQNVSDGIREIHRIQEHHDFLSLHKQGGD